MDGLDTFELYSTEPAAITAPPDSAAATAEVNGSTSPAAARGAIALVPQRTRQVVKERRTVSDDDNEATAATVKMMCDYIAAGILDPVCRFWAMRAASSFGSGLQDPRSLVWAVFWMLKHCVKYVPDEPALFAMGHRDARDLLTAPAVLVRQDEPKEDCDGFTMLACTLLRILILQCYIVTVKADPMKPDRWSHVFALVDPGDGKLMALDGSHGAFPGWMIPREHMFAHQVWNLDGSTSDVKLPAGSKLNGYVRRRGLGDICYDDTGSPYDCTPPNISQVPTESPYPVVSSPSTPGTLPSASAGSGFNLNALLASLIGNAAKVATVAEAPPGSYINPATGVISTGSGTTAQLTAGLSNYMPLIIGGVLLFGLLSAFSGRKGK